MYIPELHLFVVKKKLVNFDYLSPETDHLDDERDSLWPYLPVNVEVTLDWVSSLLSAPSPLGWKDLVLASEDPASWLLRLPLQDYLRFGQPKPKDASCEMWSHESNVDEILKPYIRLWFNHSPGCLYSKIFPSSFSKLLVFPALQWINCRYRNASQQQFDQVNSSRTLNCLKLHRRIVAGVTFSTSFFQGFGLQQNHQASTDPSGPKQQRTTKHPAWWVTRTLVKVRRFTMSWDAFASKSLVFSLMETWFNLMNRTASSTKVHKSAPDHWALQRVDGPQLRSWNPSNDQTVKSIRFIFACL